MAVTEMTMAQIAAMRIALGQSVDNTDRDLVAAWSRAWREIVGEYQAAIAELVDTAEHGWPTRTQVLRSQRAINAFKATVEAIQDLSNRAGITVTGDLPGILRQAELYQQIIANTQVPFQHDLSWARVDGRQLDAIVNRTTQRITTSMRPLTPWVDQQIKAELVRGVAVGDNPNRAAARMLSRVQGRFDGGMYRARLIARTEIVDAHRNAALQSRRANADVLAGWRWHAELSSRTCPSCLSMHGTLHGPDDPGPWDHPQGRCTAVPVTKSWADLGIDLPEPEDRFPDSRAWFDRQDASVQTEIMGRERLRQLNNGDLRWDQLAQRRDNPGWRPSYQVRPLR